LQLKIIQLIQKPQLRGAEIFASQLGNHLIEAAHDCKLISLFEGDVELPFTGELIKLNRPKNNRFSDFEGWKQLATLIKNEKPDIVQANAGDTLKFAVLSKLFYSWRTPIVFRNANKMSAFIDSKPKYWLNRFLLSKVAHVISVSHLSRRDLIQLFSFPESRIDVAEIGIEPKPIGDLPTDLLSVFDKGPVLINVGSMVPEKNQAGLLKIFSEVVKQVKNAQLIIVGKGKLENELRQLRQALGIEAQVHFLGNRKDVLEIMQKCKALLLPSHIEGLPGVVLEAMFAKCPVVAYDVGGVGEVVKNEMTGRLVKKDDEGGFVKCILTILENANHQEKIKENAFHLVTTQFENRKITKKFIDIYARVSNP
jgi:glycosyltransferase involved in cell wall biosynthesis